jgi:formamidopyrimidine-DNA glycosylase
VPELPDVTVYVERLRALAVGRVLEGIRIASPFVLRTVTPSPQELIGAKVETVARLGKRIVIGVEGARFVVIHLMIAGRLRWKEPRAKLPGKLALAGFDFAHGTLVFTEASGKKRASLHVVAGRDALAEFDRGGLDVLAATTPQFADRLRSERHTIKRALTDPTLFDGIGNAYSDEILHAAKLSPFRVTTAMTDDEIARLHRVCRDQLLLWVGRRRLSRQGHRVSPRDGSSRQVRQAVPGVRHEGAAHRVRRQRVELLPDVPDRRPPARRPLAVAPAQGRLAEDARRARGQEARVRRCVHRPDRTVRAADEADALARLITRLARHARCSECAHAPGL